MSMIHFSLSKVIEVRGAINSVKSKYNLLSNWTYFLTRADLPAFTQLFVILLSGVI